MSRGRQATVPIGIPAKGWWDIALRLKDEIAEDRISLIAAGVAFYGLLALFPAITAVLAIGGLLVEPGAIVDQMSELSVIMPEAAANILMNQATEVAGSQKGGLGLAAFVGVALAIYSASKGVSSLMAGMNVAYDESEERGFILKTAVTLGLTVFLILGLIAGLLATIAIPVILNAVTLGFLTELLGSAVVALVLFALAAFGLAVVYRYGPSRESAEFRWVSPGAITACLLWLVASLGFAYYVANFGSYNESFGALAGVVILLMWFWISAFIILLGAELNAETEAQTRYDTTTGEDQPMGQRDAVKADRLGPAQAE